MQNDALKLQQRAERNDYRPIFDFIKNIRKPKTKKGDKNITIHGTGGKKPLDINEENQIWAEYIRDTMNCFDSHIDPKMVISEENWQRLFLTGDDAGIQKELRDVRKSSKLISFLTRNEDVEYLLSRDITNEEIETEIKK